MSTGRMHADEVETSASLVRRLLAKQFPHWADLAIEPEPSSGTDNAIYRLGDSLAVRLPRIHWAMDQASFEREWLPRLAPHLPLAISTPLALGAPDEGYPWPWAVYQWHEGEPATLERLGDPNAVARDLAGFVAALRAIDPSGGPIPEPGSRGSPLATRDTATRAALDASRGILDPDDLDAATAVWESALKAPTWRGPPVWLHGDLQGGNLIVRQGRLSAVIDWGSLAVGDPACDYQIAWNFFSAGSRDTFRAALHDDEATWARGRGWALSVALIALPYYLTTSPSITARSRYTIAEVLADHRRRR